MKSFKSPILSVAENFSDILKNPVELDRVQRHPEAETQSAIATILLQLLNWGRMNEQAEPSSSNWDVGEQRTSD